VKKVVKQGGGSNLLRDLPLLERIFKAVRKAVSIPLTIKIRSGWDCNSINAVEVLKAAENCGVEALAIHGRTRCDLFSGRADWSVIRQVKENATIPIMGNGDVFFPADADRMFQETCVDGVMMGRGVLSNPWLIRQCHDHLQGNAVTPVTLEEKACFISSFLRRVQTEIPAPVAIGKMKKMGGYLSKGVPGGALLRERINAARTTEELMEVVDEFFNCGIRISDCGFKETSYLGGSHATVEKFHNPQSPIRNGLIRNPQSAIEIIRNCRNATIPYPFPDGGRPCSWFWMLAIRTRFWESIRMPSC
jgi:nifR3 family TIM-barrel protein